MHIQFRTILSLVLASLMIANPALAQSIDLSPVQNLLQGIVDTITGPLGIVIGTLALIGVFLSWLFGILDFRQALWVLVAIAGIAAAPTIVIAIRTRLKAAHTGPLGAAELAMAAAQAREQDFMQFDLEALR
ncbi:hypothetical protein MACH17_12000 [Phaeobacter inhibens]|nr:hypothetical protein MACH17_12000 [Phaeobacter inhibens]